MKNLKFKPMSLLALKKLHGSLKTQFWVISLAFVLLSFVLPKVAAAMALSVGIVGISIVIIDYATNFFDAALDKLIKRIGGDKK